MLGDFILLQSQHGNGTLEIEAKFGKYNDRRFVSFVHYVQFQRLLTLLSRLPNVEHRVELSQVAQMDDVRRITTNPSSSCVAEGKCRKENSSESSENLQETVVFQRKTRLRDFEVFEYDVRVTVSSEVSIAAVENFTPTMIRERTRHSFLLNASTRVDMTEVMHCEDKVMRPRYEVEVEFLGVVSELQTFQSQVEQVWKWLRGTHLLYTAFSKDSLVSDIVQILGGKDGNLDRKMLVQARNIKRRDLVYGGIVGNPDSNYIVSFKADGLRKMLIIHRTGIWLVFPPHEFNLVLDVSSGINQFEKFLGLMNKTVFDGELVAPLTGNTNVFWYLAFDCLAFMGDVSCQNKSYIERKALVDRVQRSLFSISQSSILRFDTKETSEIFKVEDFFEEVAHFLQQRSKLQYKDDGLIFTPNRVNPLLLSKGGARANVLNVTVYNPHSDELPLYRRVLTKVPDVCKWKDNTDLTIDFSLKWVGGDCKLELHSFDEASGKEVPFRGTKINPVSSDMVDSENVLTLNKPSGLVVEYEWHKARNMFVPRKLRPEKSGPNHLAIAEDIWDDIMHPISVDDILGRNLSSSFTALNRTKRDLYQGLPKGANILDIGSGRGGDVAKWIGTVGRVVAVEPNEANRAELVKRLTSYDMTERVRVVPTGGEDTVAITNAVSDFVGKVDAVTLMLSMSFFWSSLIHLDALVKTIVANLKPGGKVIFLTIDGEVVERMFAATQGADITILEARLHLYPERAPPFGRPLSFVLPDTIVGDQLEYLVKIQDFTERLVKYGIELQFVKPATSELLLSPENKRYSTMYVAGSYVASGKTLSENSLALENIVLPSVSVASQEMDIAKLNIGSPKNTVQPAPFSPVREKDLPVKCVPIAKRKFISAEQEVPGLSVGAPRDRDGPGINDDTYAPLTCTWYQNLVRIATIGDGNCFIHAFLKAFYAEYQNNGSYSFRKDLAGKLRADLALILGAENPTYPGHTYWGTSGKGSFSRLVLQELLVPPQDSFSTFQDLLLSGVDYSLQGLQRLFNSKSFLGNEVYDFVADVFDTDVFVLQITKEDVYVNFHTSVPGRNRKCVVIVGNMRHYEVLAVNKAEGLQTSFAWNDPFILEVKRRFIGADDCTILNTSTYDPDRTFVNDVVEAFTVFVGNVPQNIVYPVYLNEIFSDPEDPFLVTLNRLKPRIEEANRALQASRR